MDDAGELAVVEHRPAARVVAATSAARARGVCDGQRLAGALAVAPALQLRERDPALEAAVLAELADWAGQYTSAVSIDPPDTVLLETASSLQLFGGAAALAQEICRSLSAIGLHAALGGAPTPLAARWLARSRPGTLIADGTGWQSCLDALPVELLADGAPLSAAVLELLRGVGVTRIGDAARLPRDGLARRQGAMVHEILARARGKQPDPRLWHVAPERFESRLVLPASVSHTEPLLFAAGRLFAGLSAWLTARQAVLDRCCLQLEHEDSPDTRLDILTGQAGRDDGRLLMLAREHLAALELPAPVEALRLSAEHPLPAPGRSVDLFGDPETDRGNAGLLLDRLRARLGKSAVQTVLPVSEHRPERAWRRAEPGACPGGLRLPGGARPLWLMPTPRPLASTRALTLLSGPERIESGWWDGADVRRDYYVASTPEDALWWIFEDLDPPGGWYVHGYFG